VIAGPMITKRRPIRTEVSVRVAFASRKRPVSCSSRTKARTTRIPMICSRMTPLMESMLSCIRWNSGISRVTSRPTITISTGTDTHTSQDSPGSSWIAMTIPPMDMIGTMTMKFRVIARASEPAGRRWCCG
jgi:hypothetical protein